MLSEKNHSKMGQKKKKKKHGKELAKDVRN